MDAADAPERDYVEKIVREALREDAAGADATAQILDAKLRIKAALVSRSEGIIAGVNVAGAVFLEMDDRINYRVLLGDGLRAKRGDAVALIEGPAGSILSAERTALNFIQRMSGIATLTSMFVKKISRSGAAILDTRKTTPLLRQLEKYAVRIGGGANHRANLREMVMIKDNHIASAGGIESVLQKLKSKVFAVPVEIEAGSIGVLDKILEHPFARLMLDNFSPEETRSAVEIILKHRKKYGRKEPEIEVSGGITLNNIALYDIKGVDYISIGALTHSAPAMDYSLEVRID